MVVVVTLLASSACGVQAGEQTLARNGDSTNSDIIGSDVGAVTTTTEATTTTVPPTDLDINGSDGGEINDIIGNAVSDLEAWWTHEFPEAYGDDYEPLSGGLFAIDAGSDPRDVPCATTPDITDLLQNAFYCPSTDSVVWDQESFMPDFAKRHGTFTVAVVIAHEWGHVIQDRARYSAPSVITELQADCFAGSWVKHVKEGETERFAITTDDLDESLAGILSLRDAPGGDANDAQAHGSGFDRVGAFQDGFEHGVARCAEFRDGDPTPYEFPFSDREDQDNNGDLHLSGTTDDPGIVDLAFPSLAAFWTDTFPSVSDDGDDWEPLDDPVPFTPDAPPSCAGDPIEGYLLFVCIPDRFVGFEARETIPQVYEQAGDFAVATLFATQYGLDVVQQLESASDDVSATLQADCFAGAWTAALLPPDPPDDYELILSPGDLDEGVAVLLSFRSEADRDRQGPGFDRVRAYRLGVLRGAEACPTIKAG